MSANHSSKNKEGDFCTENVELRGIFMEPEEIYGTAPGGIVYSCLRRRSTPRKVHQSQ